ncbi:MAG: flippase [Deltaproteobacteria bacterium]|nr:MAG: flippase [Deltaproteobacteria bacterium]
MDKLTQGRLLARNTVWNLGGQVAPLVVAIFAIPPLIKGLGTDRFGVLTLAWVVIGYFSLFDLGLGRALTQLIAKKLGDKQEAEIPALVWTGLILMLIMGLVGTLVVGLLSPWLAQDALKIPKELQPEALNAFYLLALAIPVVTGTAGLRGFLEAYQRFDLINLIRIPLWMFTFLGPLLVLPFSHSLFPVVAILVIGRLVACTIYLILCFKVMPAMGLGSVLQLKLVKKLILFGSWMTVTNIVGPFMVFLDRFLIGGLLSMAAVAYYATPYEVVTKLLIIPGAVVGVLFPAFSASFAPEPSRTALLFGRGVKYIFVCLFPISLFIVTLASEGLDLWLGAEFAKNSTRVLQWLTLGVFINSLAQVAFALIQGAGRPDLTAKLHLLELPFYLLAIWWLIGSYGIEGAAIAWVIRIGVDAIFLFGMAHRFLPIKASISRKKILAAGAAILTLILGSLQASLVIKGVFLLLTLSTFILATWFLIFAQDERMMIMNRFKTTQLPDCVEK